MLVSILRMLVLYPIVIFGIRLMGKRQIGELQPTELVITILISNIATLPIEDPNLPLLIGIAPMLLLISAEVLLSWCALRHRGLRRLLSGSPQIIVRNGEIDQKVMQNLRFSIDDLMTALRGCNLFDLSGVQLAVVETNGKISAYPAADARAPSCAELGMTVRDDGPPEVLIADGCISAEGMQAAELTGKQLSALLRPTGLLPEQIYLLTVRGGRIVTLLKKEDSA